MLASASSFVKWGHCEVACPTVTVKVKGDDASHVVSVTFVTIVMHYSRDSTAR